VRLLIEKGADKGYVKTYGDYNETQRQYDEYLSKYQHHKDISIFQNYKEAVDNNVKFNAIDKTKTTYTYNLNILRIAKDLKLEKMINYLQSLNIKELFHSKQVCVETWFDNSSPQFQNHLLIESSCNPIEYF